MGSAFANHYMAFFEEKYVYSNHVISTNILIWKRYLDDCFCLFMGDMFQLNPFCQYLNNCYDFLLLPWTLIQTKLVS